VKLFLFGVLNPRGGEKTQKVSPFGVSLEGEPLERPRFVFCRRKGKGGRKKMKGRLSPWGKRKEKNKGNGAKLTGGSCRCARKKEREEEAFQVPSVGGGGGGKKERERKREALPERGNLPRLFRESSGNKKSRGACFSPIQIAERRGGPSWEIRPGCFPKSTGEELYVLSKR